MTSTLLAVRLPPRMLAELHSCPGIRDRFRIVAVGQHDEAAVRLAADGRAVNYMQDWPDDTNPDETFDLYAALATAARVSHAIVAQPLHWYSEAVAAGLTHSAMGVRVFWLESYFDRATLDEVGAAYTPDNEFLRFEARCATLPVRRRAVSKFEQPASMSPAVLHEMFGDGPGVVPIFGQVPGDMALADSSGGLPYLEWIDAIVAGNPDVRFLFKHHPMARTDLPAYPNLFEVDVDVLSLLAAYPMAAAYSSTVIREGVERGVRFATGGHHLLSGLTYRVTDRDRARDLVATLAECGTLPGPLLRRLSFLEHRYALRLSDPDALVRLTVDPARVLDYYRGRACVPGRT